MTIDDAIARFQKEEECKQIADWLKDYKELKSKQKNAHWIGWWEVVKYEKYEDHIPHRKCSSCNKEYDPHFSQFIKYCYNCGCKMEDKDETDN